MGPAELLPWERVLQSPVAVLLVMLAGYAAMGRVILVLWRRNQKLNDTLIEYLAKGAEFSSAVGHVGELVALSRTLTAPVPHGEAVAPPDPQG